MFLPACKQSLLKQSMPSSFRHAALVLYNMVSHFVCLCNNTTCTLCCSLLTEADAGHTEFMDEVFQNEVRFPGREWKSASQPFTDVVSTSRCAPK